MQMDLWVLRANPVREVVLDYLDLKEVLVTLVDRDRKDCRDQGELSEDLVCPEKLVLKVKEVYQELMADLENKDLRVFKVHLD